MVGEVAVALGSIANSIACTTTSLLVEPSQPKTRRAHSSAFGATPGPMRRLSNGVLAVPRPGVHRAVGVHTVAAAVPATCEPCPLQSIGSGSGWGTVSGAGLAAGSRSRRRRNRSRRRPWRWGKVRRRVWWYRWRRRLRRAGSAEIGMHIVDAGVDDTDRDAFAGGVAGRWRRPDLRCLYQRHAGRVIQVRSRSGLIAFTPGKAAIASSLVRSTRA